MPELLPRANERLDTSRPDRPSVAAAVLSAVVTAVCGLLVCAIATTVVWAGGDTGSFVDAVRSGGLLWLAAHGSGVQSGDVGVTLVPLGAVVLGVLLLRRATASARGDHPVRDRHDAARLIGGVTATYVVLGLLMTLLVRPLGAAPDLWRACLATGAVALVGSAIGTLRGSKLLADVMDDLDPTTHTWVTAALRGAGLCVTMMLGAGALLLTVALTLNLGAAITVTDHLDAGVLGGIATALLSLALVPNAAVAGGSYLAGPGFAVGVGTSVSPMGVSLGAVPLFPMLAAVPVDGHPGWWQNLFLLVPVLAGLVAGVVLARREPLVAWGSGLGRPAIAGLVGGLGFGLLCLLSHGAVGPGRMTDVGPAVGATTLVVTASMVVGAVVGAAATYAWAGRSARRA